MSNEDFLLAGFVVVIIALAILVVLFTLYKTIRAFVDIFSKSKSTRVIVNKSEIRTLGLDITQLYPGEDSSVFQAKIYIRQQEQGQTAVLLRPLLYYLDPVPTAKNKLFTSVKLLMYDSYSKFLILKCENGEDTFYLRILYSKAVYGKGISYSGETLLQFSRLPLASTMQNAFTTLMKVMKYDARDTDKILLEVDYIEFYSKGENTQKLDKIGSVLDLCSMTYTTNYDYLEANRHFEIGCNTEGSLYLTKSQQEYKNFVDTSGAKIFYPNIQLTWNSKVYDVDGQGVLSVLEAAAGNPDVYENILITGAKRVGKTSLMKYLVANWKSSLPLVVTDGLIFKEVASSAQSAQFLRDLAARKAVIIIDEAYSLLEDHPSFMANVLDGLEYAGLRFILLFNDAAGLTEKLRDDLVASKRIGITVRINPVKASQREALKSWLRANTPESPAHTFNERNFEALSDPLSIADAFSTLEPVSLRTEIDAAILAALEEVAKPATLKLPQNDPATEERSVRSRRTSRRKGN